jgi:hypothetical protein
MNHSFLQRLHYLCDVIPSLLYKTSEEDFSFKPKPEKWSKKEILGHLIDSAANNHQRFIRVQFEEVPTIFYDQNKWNALSHYNEMGSEQLIQFWTLYNKHLLHILQHIPEENLERKCNTGEPAPVSLQWLIEDYVKHLEHHLHQIVQYT